MLGNASSAADAAIAEATVESGVANLLPIDAFRRLRRSLLVRVTAASPRLLTSSRVSCP